MKKSTVVLLTCVVSALMAACDSKESTSSYVGTWVNEQTPADESFIIDRNGDNFVVKQIKRGSMTGIVRTQNWPANLKDGLLEVHMDGMTESLSIDQKSGHLVGTGTDFVRQPGTK